MSLIAKVLVRAWVEGAVKEFQIGEEIPVEAIPEHDIQALKEMNAIEDSDETAAADKAAAKADKAASREFEAARKAVQAADASVVVPPSSETAEVKK